MVGLTRTKAELHMQTCSLSYPIINLFHDLDGVDGGNTSIVKAVARTHLILRPPKASVEEYDRNSLNISILVVQLIGVVQLVHTSLIRVYQCNVSVLSTK
jgi:hypothetical protein